ncbi:MAG: hypothetical protein K9N06_02245 [Candidatus Cloacimonetes bacterium]|nr:hypothetical protein [Candidatus Cloacimonadota bacterium]
MVKSSPDLLHSIFNGHMIVAIMIAAFLLIVIFLVIMALKIQNEERQKDAKPSKGHYFNKGIATYMPLGFAISIPVGMVLKNIAIAVALGPLLGLLLGAFIGTKRERQHKSELRELSPAELKLKKLSQRLLTALIMLGFVLYIITYIILK